MKAHRPSFEALHNLPGLLPISSSRQRDPALHKANKDMKGLSGISWENMLIAILLPVVQSVHFRLAARRKLKRLGIL